MDTISMEYIIISVVVVAIFVIAMFLGKSPPRKKRFKATRNPIDSTPPSTPSIFSSNVVKEPFIPEGPSEFDMRVPNPNLWPLPPRTGYGYDLLY